MTTEREALKLALETAEGIANSDWHKWEELASPEEFERWVKSRALHMVTAIEEALAQPEQEPPTFDEWTSDYVRDNLHKLKAQPEQAGINMEKFVGSGSPVIITQAITQIPQEHSSNESAYQRGYLDGMAKRPQPLTDEQIDKIILDSEITLVNYCCDIKQTQFARAVEAAHGIKAAA